MPRRSLPVSGEDATSDGTSSLALVVPAPRKPAGAAPVSGVIVTLSNVEVLSTPLVLWAVTANPRYTSVGSARVCVPTSNQVTPSADFSAVKRLPLRVTRLQYGTPALPHPWSTLALPPPVLSRHWKLTSLWRIGVSTRFTCRELASSDSRN